MFVEQPSRQEQLLKYALVALGLTLVLVLLLAVSEMNRVPAPESMKTSTARDNGEMGKAPTEELTGTVVAVDVENSYIRVLSDKDGKIYSIAMPSSTATMENGAEKSISTITPSDKVSILVENLSDTERTDFSAVSFEVVGQKEFPRINAEVGVE